MNDSTETMDKIETLDSASSSVRRSKRQRKINKDTARYVYEEMDSADSDGEMIESPSPSAVIASGLKQVLTGIQSALTGSTPIQRNDQTPRTVERVKSKGVSVVTSPPAPSPFRSQPLFSDDESEETQNEEPSDKEKNEAASPPSRSAEIDMLLSSNDTLVPSTPDENDTEASSVPDENDTEVPSTPDENDTEVPSTPDISIEGGSHDLLQEVDNQYRAQMSQYSLSLGDTINLDQFDQLVSAPSVSQVMNNIPPTQVNTLEEMTKLQQELVKTKMELQSALKSSLEKEEEIIGIHSKCTLLQQEKEKLTNAVTTRELDLHSLKEQVKALKESLNCESKQLKDDLYLKTTALEDATRELEKCQKVGDILYFRGFQDPLSNFFKCQLTPQKGVGESMTFRSAEHLYHFRRMVAHGMPQVARQVRNARTAAKAKNISENAVPTNASDKAWLDRAVDEMIEVVKVKASQCDLFRTTLLQTGMCKLVHNMETDARWGFGKKGNGENWMGTALEQVRAWLESTGNQVRDSPLRAMAQPFTPNTPASEHKKTPTQKKVLVLSDSMLNGIDKFFDNPTLQVTVSSHSGHTYSMLKDKVGMIMTDVKPEVVVIHCGTNSVTKENRKDMTKGLYDLMKKVRWYAPAKILLSGVIHRLDDASHNPKIDCINNELRQYEDHQTLYIENNATFKYLRKILGDDGLHMRDCGKRQVAKNLELAIRTSGGTQPEVRNWLPLPRSGSDNSSPYHQEPSNNTSHYNHEGRQRAFSQPKVGKRGYHDIPSHPDRRNEFRSRESFNSTWKHQRRYQGNQRRNRSSRAGVVSQTPPAYRNQRPPPRDSPRVVATPPTPQIPKTTPQSLPLSPTPSPTNPTILTNSLPLSPMSMMPPGLTPQQCTPFFPPWPQIAQRFTPFSPWGMMM